MSSSAPGRSNRFVGLVVSAVLLSTVVTFVLNERAIFGFVRDQVEHVRMRSSENPVHRGLETGTYGAGTDVEKLIADHSPVRCYRHGPYVTLLYRSDADVVGSTEVIAKDGRIVTAFKAGFCSRDPGHLFFDQLGTEYRTYADSLEAERCRQAMAVQAAGMAVGGPAAFAYYNPQLEPTPDSPCRQ